MSMSIPFNKSISTNSDPDLRYQKAVREISKLVNMNTALRRQNSDINNNFSQLQFNFNNLRDELNNLVRQRQYMEERVRRLIDENEILKQRNDKIQRGVKNQLNPEELQELKMNNLHLEEQLDNKDNQIDELKQKLQNQGNTIIHLESILGKRNQENQELKVKLEQYEKKEKQLQQGPKNPVDKIKNPQNRQERRFSQNNECEKCSRLFKQIKSLKDWCQITDQQNINLKKKLALEYQPYNVLSYTHNGFHTSRSHSSFRLVQALQQRSRELSTQKKQENLRNKKIIKKKDKEIDCLRETKDKLGIKIRKMQQFLNKQLNYLQNDRESSNNQKRLSNQIHTNQISQTKNTQKHHKQYLYQQ